MYTRAVLLSVLVAIAEARFGQEQLASAKIAAVTSGGESGQAATLAGQSISTLLGAANPCDKLKQGDLILEQLGTGADAVAAARGLVGAEQNFNPFAASIPTICSDPTLPTNELLRGVVPLVDPAVDGSDVENANAAKSLETPFDATGLSVAEVMAANGFTNFSTKDASGAAGASPDAGASTGNGGAADVAATSSAAAAKTTAAAVQSSAAAGIVDCAATSFVTVTRSAAAQNTAVASAAPATGGATGGGAVAPEGVDPGQQVSSLGLDFGTCTPTIKREAGLNGRKDTEFTFQAIDPVINKGQQEALNPNIITNRICDQLGNVCGASAEAITACETAQADILALGTRDDSTADAWNTALGFAGTDINPDNAPQEGLIGHT